jgi:antitoxin ParD1/3/4
MIVVFPTFNSGHIAGKSNMTLNVNLTPRLEDMVRQKVADGLYNNASEVIREALRLMEAQDQLRNVRLDALRRDILDGINSGPAVAFTDEDWDGVKQRGRARLGKV